MAYRAKDPAPVWEKRHQRGTGPAQHLPECVGGRVLRVGLVNNMPEAAFMETHRGFARLVRAGAGEWDVDLRFYRIPSVSPPPVNDEARASVYGDVEELFGDPPDALVVTGTEPLTPELIGERYWGDLATLLHWAEATVPSTMLSCLAAHGALWALDRAHRVGLSAKRSGVFPQAVNQSHPLGQGLDAVAAFPHSRWNEVPGESVRSAGYDIVVGTGGEWTVAARERAERMLVLLQGHPEYAPTVLLREYRRDLRRFVDGSAPTPPRIPAGYLDQSGEELLRAWSGSVERLDPEKWRHSAIVDTLTSHILPRWSDAAVRLFANWLSDAGIRTSGSLAVGRAHA